MIRRTALRCRTLRCAVILGTSALALIGAAIAGIAIANPPAAPLSKLEQELLQQFSGVDQITPEKLQSILAGAPGKSRSGPLILDARGAGEFKVSRIPGAIRVDPEAGPEQLVKALGSRLKGREVIIYCSVGVRSSHLIKRTADALSGAGAAHVYNLSGGIFRWHNEKLPLSSARGPVDVVHPYSAYWKRYLERPEQARFSPQPETNEK